MPCPNETFLRLFIEDPDAALGELPEFEEHLADCAMCRIRIENQVEGGRRGLNDLVFGTNEESSEHLPGILGYKVQEVIGSGGFGIVYRAEHLASGRQVAVKVIPHVAPNQWRRITLERETLVQCDHPNIVTLLDYGATGAGCFFVYRWMPQSLADLLVKSPFLDHIQIANWMVQIADAVVYIHQLKIVHRDLKPSNVLLSAAGVPKLIDFGIAKALVSEACEATTSLRAGTPGYMAPEQTGRTKQSISVATDVYGLGAILYTLLVNRPPFAGADLQQVLEQVAFVPPVEPRKLRADVPRELEIICLKCLAKEAQDRYPSAEALRADLKRFIAFEPILGRPISAFTRIRRRIARHPTTAFLVLAMAVLVGVLVATLARAERRSSEFRRQFAAEEIVRQLITSTPAALASILDLADQLPSLHVDQAMAKVSASSPNESQVVSIRWLAVKGAETRLPFFNPEVIVQELKMVSAQELAMLLERSDFATAVVKLVGYARLRQELHETRVDMSRLQLAACMFKLPESLSEFSQAAPAIARGLAQRPVSEAEWWAKVFANVDEQLFSELLHTSDSECAREIAWRWSAKEPRRMVQIVPSLPPANLRKLRELPEQSVQLLRAALREKQEAIKMDHTGRTEPMAISTDFQAMLDSFTGRVTRDHGMAAQVPVSVYPAFIEKLCKNGCSLLAVHPYHLNGVPYFAVTFDRSLEQCAIDWRIPVEHVPEAIRRKQAEGWEPICFHISVEDGVPGHDREQSSTLRTVCITWRKGAREPSEWIQGLNAIEDAHENLIARDSNSIEQEIQIQRVSGINDTCEFFALLSRDRVAPRDESKRRYMETYEALPGVERQLHFKRFVELMVEKDSVLQITLASERFSEEVASVVSMGYEPIELIVHEELGSLQCLWKRRLTSASSYSVREKARLAIASWMLNDYHYVLESLKEIRDPSLRTEIVETLGQADFESASMMYLLNENLEPLQLQGLLIALLDWRKELFELRESEWLATIERLWQHPNSGVHFAADHLLRTSLSNSKYSICRPDLCNSHGLAQMKQGRNWYYGPMGLPFIVLGPVRNALIGSDERITWLLSTDRRLRDLNRCVAICAIETPQRILKQLQSQSHFPFPDHNRIGDDTSDEPAVGCGLITVLQTCRRLSELEPIEPSKIGIPALDSVNIGLRLPSGFLEKEGYRLPSNLEWEVACRAGSWSATFLGDSMEHLSEYCWSSANSELKPSHVATVKPNPLGLFDSVGNVYEAVLGESLASGESGDLENWVLNEDTQLNVRGGSYLAHRIYSSSGSSHHINAPGTDINTGFRLARPIIPSPQWTGPEAEPEL